MYKIQWYNNLADNVNCDLDGIKMKYECTSGVNFIELDYANTFVNYDDQMNAAQKRNTNAEALKWGSRIRSLSCE